MDTSSTAAELSRDALTFLPPYEAPGDDAERKVAEIWAAQLKIDRVSRHDDFFELGGDSFGAVAIALALEKAFGAPFKSSEFIEFSTVSRQAAHLAAAVQPAVPPSLTGVQLAGRKKPLFYVHGGLGMTFLDRRFLDLLGPDQPIYFFRLPGLDGQEEPLATVEAIAARYVAAMRQVRPKGPYRISANCSCGVIGLEMALQLARSGERVDNLILIDPSDAPLPARGKGVDQWVRRASGRMRLVLRNVILSLRGQSDSEATWDLEIAAFAAGYRKAVQSRTNKFRKLAAADQGEGAKLNEASDAIISHALAVLIQALRSYQPDGAHNGRIDIVSSEGRRGSITSWQAYGNPVIEHLVPGLHKEVFRSQLPQTVAAINSALSAV